MALYAHALFSVSLVFGIFFVVALIVKAFSLCDANEDGLVSDLDDKGGSMVGEGLDPYRGYRGTVAYSEGCCMYHGYLVGISDFVSYQGNNREELERKFRLAVDDYLEFCEEAEKDPPRLLDRFSD